MEPERAGRCSNIVKLMLLVLVGALVLAASGTAVAKVAAFRLTVDGPGMRSTGVVRESRLLARAWSVLLYGNDRARTQPPSAPGSAYVLAYAFQVHDEGGSRTETVHQTLYPFASGEPVVFNARGQKIDSTYGAVRFASGWFKVPPWFLRRLQQAGLPTVAQGPELATNKSTAARPDARSQWPWLLGVGALVTAAATALQRRKQQSRREGTRAQIEDQ